MSLDKAIKFGKEKRKPYRKEKAIAPSCRNHGAVNGVKKTELTRIKKEC